VKALSSSPSTAKKKKKIEFQRLKTVILMYFIGEKTLVCLSPPNVGKLLALEAKLDCNSKYLNS
jgi:hypothetical protein